MKRSWTLGVVLLCACADKPLGDVIAMQDIVPPSPAPTCTVDPASAVFRPRGRRDLAIPLTTKGYTAGVRIRNLTSSANVAVDTKFGPYNDLLVSNTNVIIDGVNLCYETDRTDDAIPKDAAKSCDQLKSAPKGFSPGAATLAPGLSGLTSVDLFPPDVASSLGLSVAANERKVVYVHIQATGRTASGTTVNSNEMIFPVEFCNGCLFETSSNCPTVQGVPQYATSTVCSAGQDDFVACAKAADVPNVDVATPAR